MRYLESFRLPGEMQEYGIICKKKNVHNTLYPMRIFPERGLSKVDFDEITIFYGGNGSGKTTLLQIISEKIGASRKNICDLGELFANYVQECQYSKGNVRSNQTRLILSDDVFDYLLCQRAENSNISLKKELLSAQYKMYKSASSQKFDPLDDIDKLKRLNEARSLTESAYIRRHLGKNIEIPASNGETALEFWNREIDRDSLYLVDEPENSLSAENQIKLRDFIEVSARFYGCQFIIATHSPFLLSLKNALIYNLDLNPVRTQRWTELENVRTYYNFFMENQYEFDE